MSDTVYVNWILTGEGNFEPRVFEDRRDASAHAVQAIADDAERVEIYEIALPDMPEGKRTYAAVAALRMGEGKLVEARCSRTTETEYERARNREFEHAKKLGPEAMLKFLGL